MGDGGAADDGSGDGIPGDNFLATSHLLLTPMGCFTLAAYVVAEKALVFMGMISVTARRFLLYPQLPAT